LRWRSANFGEDYKEWYYPALRAGVTHVGVNVLNTRQRINFLNEHPDVAQRIALNGLAVHKTFLCPCCLVAHFVRVFQLLAKKLAYSPRRVLLEGHRAWRKVTADPVDLRKNNKCMCTG